MLQAHGWQKRVDLRDFDDFYTTIMLSSKSVVMFLIKMMSELLKSN